MPVVAIARSFLADSGSNGSISLPPWAVLVIALVTAVALATKQLVPGWMYQDIKADRDDYRNQVKELNAKLYDVSSASLPALQSATKVVEEAAAEIRILRRGNG